MRQARNNSADVVVYDFVPFTDGDMPPELDACMSAPVYPILDRAAYFSLPHFAWLKFIRADLLRVDLPPEGALRFPAGLFYEDWPFHWKLGFQAEAIVHLPVAGIAYRQRESSITGSRGRELLDLFAVQESVLSAVIRCGDARDAAALAPKIYASFWGILTRIELGVLREALRCARRLRSAMGRSNIDGIRGARALVMDLVLAVPAPLCLALLYTLRGLKCLTDVIRPFITREVSR